MKSVLRPSFRRIVSLFCLGFLTGCGGGDAPEVMFRNYIERVGNVTGFQPATTETMEGLPPYPRTRDLVLPEVEVRVGVLSYLALGECRLLQEVGERNSSLGRVQAASGRLLYEMRFYDQISTCERDVRQSRPDDRGFLDELAAIRRAKEIALPRAFWNATFASPEFHILLSTGTPPLQRNEALSLAEIEAALATLTRLGNRLRDGPRDLSLATLEERYFELQRAKVAGKLLQGLHLSRHHLVRATEILRQTADAGQLCPMGRKTTRGEYLHNVFVKFYAGEVQPYIAMLHRHGAPFLGLLHELRRAETVEPPVAFLAFYDRWLSPETAEGLWQSFDRAVKDHTRGWQAVLTQCGLMPRGPEDLQ